MRWRSNLVRVGVLLCWTSAVGAQDTKPQADDESDYVVMGASADPAKCNIGNAIPMKFDAAMRGGADIVGRCVVVNGYWVGRALFGNRSDGRHNKAIVSPGLSGRRLGLYGTERMLLVAPTRPTPYRLVGIFGRCETQWPGATMVLGYCHYTSGPILLLAEAYRD